jgi:hypothetical protein
MPDEAVGEAASEIAQARLPGRGGGEAVGSPAPPLLLSAVATATSCPALRSASMSSRAIVRSPEATGWKGGLSGA